MGDKVNSSMGNDLAESLKQKVREQEARIDRDVAEHERKRLEAYWREGDEHEEKKKSVREMNDTQLHLKATSGSWEKDLDRKQHETYIDHGDKYDAKEREKRKKARQPREEMDEDCWRVM